MAGTKKSSSGRRTKTSGSGAKRGAQTRRKNAEMAKRHKRVVKEVYMWIAVALALFLFLSNFGICGIVGNALRSVMLGCFGWMGFVFPVVLTIIVGIIAYNEINSSIVSKAVTIGGLFFDLCLFFHLFSYGGMDKSFKYFYTEGASGNFCGGIVGGFLGEILHSLLGLTGAYIIAVVILMICIVVLTERSIMSAIQSRSRDAYENVKEDNKIRREAGAKEREQRRAEKIEKKKELQKEQQRKKEEKRSKRVGIDFSDTEVGVDESELQAKKDNAQEVHEIHIEGIDDPVPDMPEQDETVYTYEQHGETAANVEKPVETERAVNDEHATDGEFTPKERVILSEEAKKTMARKPFGMSGAESHGDSAESTSETLKEQPKKASSEGKIIAPTKKKMKYRKPSFNLLKDSEGSSGGTTKATLMETANKLKQVLANFGVNVEITNVSKGPSVTRYELQPEMGTKVSRITGLADDIKLNMAAADIRIEAPIPGKAAVGIEIPNKGRDSVCLKELLMSKELRNHKSKLAFPAGKDIAGKVVVADIAKMPHMLIAGTTGSGKSVFTNSILMSILYRTTPEEVRLIVIDPKVVEFQVYNKIPHLLYEVVTDPKKAAGILNWAVAEMTTRYKKFANAGARDIAGYNAKVEAGEIDDETAEKMPQILIVIDELADLMMVAAKEVEEAICRLAQLARAAGIHMVIATQRPSVDVITGLIKANIPSRVALTVASGTDSRTIIDMNGAEKLLGNGDMLFYPAGYVKPVRVQGAYVSDKEIFDTVQFIKNNSGEAEYDESIDAKLTTDAEAMSGGGDSSRDPLFADAGRLCIEKQKGSTSMLQRQFRVGFNRAARIMEQLYDAGVVGQEEQNKPRRVIMSMEEFEEIIK